MKKGYVHGQTDEFSHYAVDGIVHHYDWLATVLHLFGLNHQELTYKNGPRTYQLVEQPEASIVRELLG